jgi:hypothetical protein
VDPHPQSVLATIVIQKGICKSRKVSRTLSRSVFPLASSACFNVRDSRVVLLGLYSRKMVSPKQLLTRRPYSTPLPRTTDLAAGLKMECKSGTPMQLGKLHIGLEVAANIALGLARNPVRAVEPVRQVWMRCCLRPQPAMMAIPSSPSALVHMAHHNTSLLMHQAYAVIARRLGVRSILLRVLVVCYCTKRTDFYDPLTSLW